MEILQQLGANSTAIIQFFIFALSIAFLTVFVFNPYFKAYDQRLLKTKGAENVAKDTIEETKNLNLIFQSKAREVNDKIKSIYDVEKNAAQKTTEDLIKAAKADSELIVKNSRTEISSQVAQSKSQVESLSKEIAQQLTQKFESGL
jgi:F0F1-type ATP synthase membrane subunit b/b'